MNKLILLSSLVLLTGWSCNVNTESEDILADLRLEAPDSEFSHTMIDSNFAGSTAAVGTLQTQLNPVLTSNSQVYIEQFLENQDVVYLSEETTYTCTVNLLGYDDRYAYARVVCDSSNGSGRGDAMRFEYDASNAIVDFTLVGNDTPVEIIFPPAVAEAYYTPR